MAKVFLPLCLLALFLHGSTAQFGFGSSPWQSSRHGAQSQCRFERLSALEPKRRVKSEGGVTEYFDNNNEQLKCAGLAAFRRTIQPQGLSLSSYFNAHQLIYILKGRGVVGLVIPGCPEIFQKQQGEQQKQQGEQQQQGQKQQGEKQQHGQQQKQGEQQQHGQQQQQTGDRHQRILQFRQGDILAIPAGIAHWCYNDGDSPVVAVTVLDTSNNANQLDNSPRKFSLAGQEESTSNNVFRGFQLQLLADALGVSRELTKKLQQGQNGEIIKVQRELRMVMPPRSEREEKQEKQTEGRQEQKGQSEGRQEQEQEKGGQSNGLEQAFCTLRFRENIDKPSHADVYNSQAGRYTYLNDRKLPILNSIQMSAARGVLYKGATIAPHWNINAHSVIYVTGGRGRIQIVGDQGRSVFDDEIREGQTVVVPQHFAAVIQARDQQFEWVSFKTHGNAIASQIVGPESFFRGLPEDVIVESYKGISRGEARNLKDQGSLLLVPPTSSQQQGGRAEA